MTGFGTAAGDIGSVHVEVEVRSVNHRFFSPSIRLPSALARWEGDVRDALRKQVSRGHVTLSARIERVADVAVTIDEKAFANAVAELRALQERHALGGDLDISTILRVPGVVSGGGEDPVIESPDGLLGLVDASAKALMGMREAEGARMGVVVRERLALIESALGRIAVRAPQRVLAHRDKVRANVAEIAGGIAVDEQRLTMEIAMLAERLDVGEELDRFTAHIAAFRETLDARTDEPVGKRLGFLLQEMLREANTTGSKANDSDMQRDVVLVKEELERIREQVENLE